MYKYVFGDSQNCKSEVSEMQHDESTASCVFKARLTVVNGILSEIEIFPISTLNQWFPAFLAYDLLKLSNVRGVICLS